jgi:hypothetical protein
MECSLCHKTFDSGHLTTSHGFVCTDCLPEHQRLENELHDELRQEGTNDGPARFDLPAFERFALKAAVHMLHNLSPEDRERYREKIPWILIPDQLALEIKDRLIQVLPDYFSTWTARGHERIFHGGTYRIIKPIPKSVLLKACRTSKLFA